MSPANLSQLRNASAQALGMGGPGVLVTEDDANLRAVICEALKVEGFKRIYQATDGDECLRVLKQNAGSIKVLVLDLMMPNQSGAHVMDALYQMNPAGLGVLMMSGHEDSLSTLESKYRTSRVNFRIETLTKPFPGETLVTRVKGLLMQIGGPSALSGLGPRTPVPAQARPTPAPSAPVQAPPQQQATPKQPQSVPAPLPTPTPPVAPPFPTPSGQVMPQPPAAQTPIAPTTPPGSSAGQVLSSTDLHRLHRQLASLEGQLSGLQSSVFALRQLVNELSGPR